MLHKIALPRFGIIREFIINRFPDDAVDQVSESYD